jgi:pimeloyl-ACP methyl ester carboxylesterase
VDRPFRYETLGDDVAGLIGHLGLGRADVMGYSFGATTALRTAIQHPHLVRRLVMGVRGVAPASQQSTAAPDRPVTPVAARPP